MKQTQSAFGLPAKVRKFIAPGPRPVEGHDEWLLDEAPAETFPASDSIAVSPSHLLRPSIPLSSQTVEGASKIADSSSGRNKDPKAGDLEAAIECDYCHTRIAATVALSFEGADYVYHFCGPQCRDASRNAAIAHDK